MRINMLAFYNRAELVWKVHVHPSKRVPRDWERVELVWKDAHATSYGRESMGLMMGEDWCDELWDVGWQPQRVVGC